MRRVLLEFNALNCIDPVTNLTEAILINNKTSKNISEQFQNSCLSQYPRPVYCIHDRGGELIGEPFQTKLTDFGVKAKPTTAKNPTANAICERMHHAVGDILRSIKAKIADKDEAEQAMDNALYTCMHVLRCAVNHTMQTSPGALVFRREMLMDVHLIADLDTIRGRRQKFINDNLIRLNKKRADHNCSVNDRVLLRVADPVKMEDKFTEPYRIARVFANGTIDLELEPTIVVRFSIRKVVPYRGLLRPPE